MAYDDTLSLLDNADPQTLQMMLEALGSGEQLGMGHEMFSAQPSAAGMNVGHTYVAASPLEHAADAVKQIVGARMMQQGQQQRAGGIQAFINALRAKPPAPAPVQAPQMMEPPVWP